ncbi:MAG: hypothetical protein HYZ45_09720 [Burkholderiales bacterium]|nr:hypothetical protein [Burkholderiales bacterium]
MGIWKAVDSAKRKYLWAWVMLMALVYLAIGLIASDVVQGEKVNANRNHAMRMAADQVEPGRTAPDPIPATGDFVPVTVGVYIDGIDNFSIRDSFWTTTFFIWFRWQGAANLDPGKTFQLVDAKIEKKELLDSYSENGVNYQRFRVQAKVTKFFNTTRVPLDDHMLNLQVEDGARDASQLRYIADDESNISSRVRVPGYSMTGFTKVIKNHTYKTAYGDPRVTKGKHATFTDLNIGISVKRNSMGVYFKSFIGLFAGMLLTFTSFLIRASEGGPRVSMPVGSYFGAVANSYLVSSMLPSSGQFGLVEYVSFLGLFTIFTCLLAAVVSMFIWHVVGDKELSRAFDKATLTVIGLGYLAINIILPINAFS